MTELSVKERLQPSLLDRLTDDEPGSRDEARDRRVINMRQLRESVRRDLAWLFNTTRLSAVQPLDDFPLVAASVLNFGTMDLSGHALINVDEAQLKREIKRIISHYEPRILPNTIDVQAYIDYEGMSPNSVSFEIHGELWAQPVPQQLFLKTEVDLERGDVYILDYNAQ